MLSYDTLAHVIKMGGTVAFTAVFVGAIIYAVWPGNRARFERASHMPLAETDAPEVDVEDND